MTVLELHHVCKGFGAQDVLTGVSFKIQKGDKVGLIGENGCGKSTLLKMITGQESPTEGAIVLTNGLKVGYLAQHVIFEPGRTVAEEIASVFADVHQMQIQMRQLEQQMVDFAHNETKLADIMRRYSRLQEAFDRAEGYGCQARAEAVMDGLGIVSWAGKLVDVLSGGEKNLVGLSKVLLGKPDLLLLDEPGNHLDFAGLSWLEGILQTCDQTVIMVSHDRYLLDRVVNRIVEIEDGKATLYSGNYSAYRAEKMRQLIQQKAAFDDQQKEIRRMKEMIKRFELWAHITFNPRAATQARSKQKMLDRMDKIDKPVMDRRRIDPAFASGSKSGKIALQLRRYHRQVGDRTLFEGVEFLLQSGDRAGFIGANGTGKSTLFKDVVAQAAWDHPVLRIGPRIKLGYYAQEHETLDENRTIIEEVCLAGNLTREQGFGVLARFLFGWNEIDKKVKSLSGGEKSRVQLAKLMISGANFLLLDEPTNHLDIPSREQVETALETFEGTLLIISHDRYFLDKISDRIVEVANLGLVDHPGNFSDFWTQKQMEKQNNLQVREEVSDQMGEIESKIEELESEKLRLERAMETAFAKRDFKRGDQCSKQLRQLERQIVELYEEL